MSDVVVVLLELQCKRLLFRCLELQERQTAAVLSTRPALYCCIDAIIFSILGPGKFSFCIDVT